MRALIIVPPYTAKPVSYYNLPMGLLYVAAAVRKQYDVKILNLNEIPFFDFERVIKTESRRASIVLTGGLSVHYNFIKQIVDIVKKHCPSTTMVVGGGIVTSQSEVIAKILDADLFVSGEGDNLAVADAFYDKHVLFMSSVKNLDNIFPAYDLFNMELYLNLQRPSDSHYRMVTDYPRDAAIIASRGCPYQCTFCFHPTGNTYRQRSLNSVFAEIEMLVENYNINILSVYDECFAIDKKRLTEFCERIKKLHLHWSCQLRVDSVDLDTLKMLKDSGCYIISFGIESASDKILKGYKKNITVKQINNALEWSRAAGIVVQGNILIGAEDETLDTVEESMKWHKEHHEYQLSVGPVIPYPGTVMYKNAVAKGLIDPVKFLEDGCPAVNCSGLDINKANEIISKYLVQTSAPVYDMRYESEPDFFGRIKLQFKSKCPYCNHEQTRKNWDIGMVEGGIKWCEKCSMRYFLRKGE